MSYDTAYATVFHTKKTTAWWEWIACEEWVKSKKHPGEGDLEVMTRLYEEYDFDFGCAGAVAGIGTGNVPEPLPGIDVEDIYEFLPEHPPQDLPIDYVKCLGISPAAPAEDMAEVFHKRWYAEQSRMGKRSMVPGGHYHQILHYFSTTFGFEPTIMAAFEDEDRFRRVVERFAELTRKIHSAWAMTGVEMMICHDDLAMRDRTIFSPEWNRQFVLRYYDYIWEPLRAKNIAILFMSDGKIDGIAPDICKLHPNGIFVDEPCDLEYLSGLCGEDMFLMGNVRGAELLSNDERRIRAEIDRVITQTSRSKNRILRASAGLDETLPAEAVEKYMNAVRAIRRELAADE